jgi:hypothetical protein
MIKISYNSKTAVITGVYAGDIEAKWPFIVISDYEWRAMQGKNLRVINRKLTALPEPDKILAQYDKAMEDHIYSVRAARGYTTREPGVYINSTVPRWKADAEVWNAWLDAVMQYSLNILNTAKETGEVPALADYINNAPVIKWLEIE